MEQIQHQIEIFKRNLEIIIACDFNGRTGRKEKGECRRNINAIKDNG